MSSGVIGPDAEVYATPDGPTASMFSATFCRSGIRISTCPPGRSTRRNSFRATGTRSEEHTSELQSLMRTSYAVFCLKQKIIADVYSPHKTMKLKRTHDINPKNKH